MALLAETGSPTALLAEGGLRILERSIGVHTQLADAVGERAGGLLGAALGSTALCRDERAVASPRLDESDRLQLAICAGNRICGQTEVFSQSPDRRQLGAGRERPVPDLLHQ